MPMAMPITRQGVCALPNRRRRPEADSPWRSRTCMTEAGSVRRENRKCGRGVLWIASDAIGFDSDRQGGLARLRLEGFGQARLSRERRVDATPHGARVATVGKRGSKASTSASLAWGVGRVVKVRLHPQTQGYDAVSSL